MQEWRTGSPLMCFICNAAIRICPYGRQSSGGPWSHRHCGSPFPPQGKLMAKSFTYDRIARQAPAELIEVLRAQAEPLPAPQPAEEFGAFRSEDHTSEPQSLMRISYAVFCLKKKKEQHKHYNIIKN